MPDPNNYTPLDEVEEWVANVVALQDGWPPNGGTVDPANNGGLLNWPLLQLASRTLWLKAQQAQLASDLANLDVSTQINAAIDALINGAPAALDTLSELAAALQNSDDQVAALIAQISGKLAKNANLSDLQNLTIAQNNLGLKGGAFLDVSANADLSVDNTKLPTRAAVAGALGEIPTGVFSMKAMVVFSGPNTGAVVLKSGNVSGVTRIAEGRYQVDLASPAPDTSYAVFVQASYNDSAGTQYSSMVSSVTTDGFVVSTAGAGTSNNTQRDNWRVSVAVYW